MFGENNLGAILLNIESMTSGKMKVITPSRPGLSNSLDICTSALESFARCIENEDVASFIPLVFAIDRLSICVELVVHIEVTNKKQEHCKYGSQKHHNLT